MFVYDHPKYQHPEIKQIPLTVTLSTTLRAVDAGRSVTGAGHPHVAMTTQLPLLRRRIAADYRDVITAVTYPATSRCAELAASDRCVVHDINDFFQTPDENFSSYFANSYATFKCQIFGKKCVIFDIS